MGKNATIYKSSVYAGDTCLIAILFTDLTGTPYAKSQISSIVYSITDMGNSQYDTAVVVSGHDNVSLDVNSVFFDPENRTYNGSTIMKNFEWVPDPSSTQPFPTSNHRFRIRIKVTPTVGICTPVVIDVEAI